MVIPCVITDVSSEIILFAVLSIDLLTPFDSFLITAGAGSSLTSSTTGSGTISGSAKGSSITGASVTSSLISSLISSSFTGSSGMMESMFSSILSREKPSSSGTTGSGSKSLFSSGITTASSSIFSSGVITASSSPVRMASSSGINSLTAVARSSFKSEKKPILLPPILFFYLQMLN